MYRKCIALLAALVVMLMIVGCTPEDKPGESTASPTLPSVTVSREDPTEATQADVEQEEERDFSTHTQPAEEPEESPTTPSENTAVTDPEETEPVATQPPETEAEPPRDEDETERG